MLTLYGSCPGNKITILRIYEFLQGL